MATLLLSRSAFDGVSVHTLSRGLVDISSEAFHLRETTLLALIPESAVDCAG